VKGAHFVGFFHFFHFSFFYGMMNRQDYLSLIPIVFEK